MKYLTFIRHSESYRESPPPPALMEAMGKFVERSLKDGTLVETGGLLPSKDGRPRAARQRQDHRHRRPVHREQGGHRRLGHPEARDSKAEAIRIATEFMELHRKHWPELRGRVRGAADVRPRHGPVEVDSSESKGAERCE